MKKENGKWYHKIGAALEKLDMLGVPISIHFKQDEEFKAKTGGFFSILLYTIMSYVLVYLSIRVFKGNTIEISETVVDSDNVLTYRKESPFNDTQFNIAYLFDVELK